MLLCERTFRRERRVARLLAACASVALALAALAAQARAGRYHVYACSTPAGQSAPADGWTPSTTGGEAVAQDTCAQGRGALVAGLTRAPRSANAAASSWVFSAPAQETIVGATVWRAGDTDGGWEPYGTYEFWLAGPGEGDFFDTCQSAAGCGGEGHIGQPHSQENYLRVPIANLGSHLYVGAACGGIEGFSCPGATADPNGYAAVIYLYAADLVLEQTAPPSVSGVTGELASAPVVSGASSVAFGASDAGSGVYEAVFSVDGRVVQTTALDEDGGRCRNVGETTDGLPAFLYVQPCPASLNADVGFDTTRVGNGAHHLVVSVLDAAGNAATVLDRDITVENQPPPGGPNGTNASPQAALAVAWKGARRARLTSGYGRAHTAVGRLTNSAGAPIAGAQIEVLATPDYEGARTAAIAGVRTDSQGRFAVRLAPGSSSRTLRFRYSDELGAAPVVAKTLALTVRAAVSLRIAPRTASVGRSIHFSGRLLGRPVPGGGKSLVLEARSQRGAWLEFDVVRSDAHGRYHASYRFKFAGPARYQFRVLCEHEPDYPFARGASRVVGVFER